MFSTKNLVHDVKSVPVNWIFEHFCKLPQKLDGNDIKINSVFNIKERTPSMCIYVDAKNNVYKYKDFSTGRGGSALDLIKELYNIKFHQACSMIIEQYNDYVLHNNGGYDVQEFKQQSKYKIDSVVFRSWSTQDSKYWTQFNIGSKLLDEHNVRPLEYYKLIKEEKELYIRGNYIYGYFKADGTLFKIYQPKTLDKKFLKINDYIQGSEQLKNNQYLIITSSLKDIMALKSMKLAVDIIAPDSENSMIRKESMENYIKNYSKVIVLFDYDKAGMDAMQKYKLTYPSIEICVLPMSKDPSDSIKDHGAKEVRDRLVPILNKKIVD